MTLPERLLWVRLRHRDPGKPTFRRQHPVGPYILDFFCSDAHLCVEVDGQAHLADEQFAHDQRHTAYLRSVGIRVLRYTAVEVLADPDEIAHNIVETARRALTAPPPSAARPPPPQAGEER